MSAPLPAPGAAQVRIEGTLNGRPWSVSSYWGDTHALEYSPSDISNLNAAVFAAWGTHMQALLSHDCATAQSVCTDLFSDTAPRDTLVSIVAGAGSLEALPLNVAMRLKFEQDRRYRGGKSGIFIPGFQMDATTNESTWAGGAITAAGNAWGDIDGAAAALTTSHGNQWEQIAVSRFSGGAERGAPILFKIVGVSVQPRICSRRKRLPKISG